MMDMGTNELPKRKRTRLAEYDYSTPGAYFLTICTHEKRCILSDIHVGEGLAPPAVVLTEVGEIAQAQLLALAERFPRLRLDKYAVMPNHVHILLTLMPCDNTGGASPSPTVIDVVRAYKSITTRLARPYLSDSALWQRSFHDHVVRGEADHLEIWNYIDGNPAKWTEDCFYPSCPAAVNPHPISREVNI